MNYQISLDCQVKGLNEIYLKYFGYKTNGFFIDIGAYDGVLGSMTFPLAEAGWEGICYEPVPQFFSQCAINHLPHKNVRCLPVCIGNRKGDVIFYVAGTLSTYNEDYFHSDYWKNDYKYASKIIAPIITLDESLEVLGIESNSIDVISWDTEGSESDGLKHFNIKKYKPKMVIIEAQELHPAKELTLQAPFINQYFADAGYVKIYCDEINSIFVKGDLYNK
jgi:FkbM family methyltransferase